MCTAFGAAPPLHVKNPDSMAVSKDDGWGKPRHLSLLLDVVLQECAGVGSTVVGWGVADILELKSPSRGLPATSNTWIVGVNFTSFNQTFPAAAMCGQGRTGATAWGEAEVHVEHPGDLHAPATRYWSLSAFVEPPVTP